MKVNFKFFNNYFKRIYVSRCIKKEFFFDLIISNTLKDFFANKYKKLMILPHSQHIYSEKNNSYILKTLPQTLKETFLFFSNRDEEITKKIYKDINLLNVNTFCIGYPKYTKNWYAFLSKNFHNTYKYDLVIFIGGNYYYNLIGPKKFYQDLQIIIDFIYHFNLKAVFKLHPRHKIFDTNNKFLKQINDHNLYISDDHPLELSKKSKFVIAQWSSTIMDAIFMKKPVINFTKNLRIFNSYNSLKFIYKVTNKNQLYSTYRTLKKNNFKNKYHSNFTNYIKSHENFLKEYMRYLEKIFI